MVRHDREIVLDKQLELRRDNLLYPEEEGPSWPYNNEENFIDRLHEAYNSRLEDVVRPRKANHVLQFLSLQELILDFQYSTCIGDCCPMQYHSIKALNQGFALGMPASVRVLGLASDGVDLVMKMKHQDCSRRRMTWRTLNSKESHQCRGPDNAILHGELAGRLASAGYLS